MADPAANTSGTAQVAESNSQTPVASSVQPPADSNTSADGTQATTNDQSPTTPQGTQATGDDTAAKPTEPAVDPNAKKILIIEDERPLAHALELKLGHSGFTTQVAGNGNEALDKLKDQSFDVLLLDLILPELDGFALLKQIREKDEGVKVVILSNLGQDEDRERVAPYNVSEYYVKSNTPLATVVNSIQSLTTT